MGLPWHKWFHGTWLSSETRFGMSLAERGLYRDALDVNYAEGSIPAAPTALRRMLGVDQEEFEKAWPKVAEHFEPVDGDPSRLANPKAAEVLEGAADYRRRQAENGRRGGRPASENPAKSKAKPQRKASSIVAKPKPKPNASHKEEEEEETHSRLMAETSWEALFEQWWALYPRTKGCSKSDARKAYSAIVVNGKVKPEEREDLRPFTHFADRHGQLVTATKRYAVDFAKRPPEKVPHPATFLRRLDWLNPPTAQSSAPRLKRSWES